TDPGRPGQGRRDHRQAGQPRRPVAVVSPAAPTEGGRRTPPALLGLIGLVGFAALLEIAPRLGLVPSRYLPPTSRIAAGLVEQAGRPEFWRALLDTLRTWAIGL